MSLGHTGSKAARSEDDIPNAFDKCTANTLIKMGSTVAVGTALSLVLFRRRLWPIYIGFGVGMGMAISDCRAELNSTGVVQRNMK